MLADWQLHILEKRIDEKRSLIQDLQRDNAVLKDWASFYLSGSFLYEEIDINNQVILLMQKELAQDLALYKELTNNRL